MIKRPAIEEKVRVHPGRRLQLEGEIEWIYDLWVAVTVPPNTMRCYVHMTPSNLLIPFRYEGYDLIIWNTWSKP